MTFVLGAIAFFLFIHSLFNGYIIQYMIFLFVATILIELVQKFLDKHQQEEIAAQRKQKEEKYQEQNKRINMRHEIKERKEIIEIDYKYGRVPEKIYRTVMLLNGFYSLEEWEKLDPVSFNRLSDNQKKIYRDKLYDIKYGK